MQDTAVKLTFAPSFAALALALLLVELAIAAFVHDGFVRPFLGDLLVVVLIFAVCRTFLRVDHRHLALGVLSFAFAIELGQYFNLVQVLGLQHHRLARIVIGTTFDLQDLLAYGTGIALILAVDALWTRRSRSATTTSRG